MTVAELIASLEALPPDMKLDGTYNIVQRREPPEYGQLYFDVDLFLYGTADVPCEPILKGDP